MKQKILLLTCGTGEGHNSAASAVAEALGAQGVETVRRDPISFAGEKAKRPFPVFTIKSSKRRRRCSAPYTRPVKRSTGVRFQSPVYYANTVYAKKLAAYILDEKFDAVVCTHLFAMEALTYIKKCGLLTVPSYGVLTITPVFPFLKKPD